MMPDKIFLIRNKQKNKILRSWGESCVSHDGYEFIEYIRKNALLEWLKKQKKDCERIIREHPEDESLWCERDRYDELIDKINSL
jgi:hypothetical protein